MANNELPPKDRLDSGRVAAQVCGKSAYGGSVGPRCSVPGWKVPIAPVVSADKLPCWKKKEPELDAKAQKFCAPSWYILFDQDRKSTVLPDGRMLPRNPPNLGLQASAAAGCRLIHWVL